MNEVVISADGLGKRYLIGHQARYRQMHVSFRDMMVHTARGLMRSTTDMIHGRQIVVGDEIEEFWALKEISFEIRRGEVVGIIGRNGAGKSTLLKVLSRITEPSEGCVRIKGRVASLLEVGTGFHPELSGRENILLNGAILGMTRDEVRQKFDEIVCFAGVENFIDTPVKRYSSGMYVRLAFAVAAHLEPEILIIDEVLAVGDAEFQKKCLGKMQEVAGKGRTVLFVSHNLGAVERLCNSAIVLEGGKLLTPLTDVHHALATYIAEAASSDGVAEWRNIANQFNHPVAQPQYFAILHEDGSPLSGPCRGDEQLNVLIECVVNDPDPALNIGIAIYGPNSELLMWSNSTDGPEAEWPRLEKGKMAFRCKMPTRFFNEGIYRAELMMSLHCREWLVQPGYNSPALRFTISGGLSDSPYWTSARPGILAPTWRWKVEKTPSVGKTCDERNLFTDRV